tara:strand:- start:262 stop:762 length:501 start_codon:yes stop_codon:yes gene_type:complete
MKIDVKYNIDFKRLEKEFEQKKLEETLNEGVSDKFAKNSANFIKAGKVKPHLKQLTINVKRKEGSRTPKTPLMMTGKLVNSLKGSKEGIKGVNYGKKHREGEYTWTENTSYKVLDNPTVPGKGLNPRKREFITAAIESEKSANNKIYKEFQDKFVKLLSKALRKRR